MTHITTCPRCGACYKMVAEAANLATSIVFSIRTGERKRIRARTARRILAVTTACRGDAALVSAARTWQLISLLLDEGYTRTALARLLGSTSKTPALQIRRDRVTARTAANVERLYRRLTT